MTADEQINRLDARIDRLESQWLEEIRRVHIKLDVLAESGARNACPSPGACILLGERLEHQILAHNSTMLRVERLEIRMLAKDKKESWLLGAWAVIALFAAALGTVATIVVNHYLP